MGGEVAGEGYPGSPRFGRSLTLPGASAYQRRGFLLIDPPKPPRHPAPACRWMPSCPAKLTFRL
jgi:hypothetical protein